MSGNTCHLLNFVQRERERLTPSARQDCTCAMPSCLIVLRAEKMCSMFSAPSAPPRWLVRLCSTAEIGEKAGFP